MRLTSRSAVCEAWLGPSYQLQGSLNATFKGGDQQAIHRDYRMSYLQFKRNVPDH